MSSLYLVRHGQAGLRHNYDTLSDLGRRQAGLLGEYLVAQGVRFAAIYAGALVRQQQTAEQVRQAYLRAGLRCAGDPNASRCGTSSISTRCIAIWRPS